MPSRFTSVALGLAVSLLLAACGEEAQQQAERGQDEDQAPAQTQPAESMQPAPAQTETAESTQPAPAQTETAETAQTAPTRSEEPATAGGADAPDGTGQPQEQQAAEGAGNEEVLVVPPAEDTTPADEREAARAPGEPSPEAAGVASVAAYVGRWAEEQRMCEQNFWTFTNLRLQSPDDLDCDIQDTEEREAGVALQVACMDRDQPLAEPDAHAMNLTFPNIPQTDTMVVSGGPIADDLTLSRCRLGQGPAAVGLPETQNR